MRSLHFYLGDFLPEYGFAGDIGSSYRALIKRLVYSRPEVTMGYTLKFIIRLPLFSLCRAHFRLDEFNLTTADVFVRSSSLFTLIKIKLPR